MKIIVNAKEYNFDVNPSINELIERFNLDTRPIVVELNGIIVNKEDYNNKLNNNDKLEIVSFVGGG